MVAGPALVRTIKPVVSKIVEPLKTAVANAATTVKNAVGSLFSKIGAGLKALAADETGGVPIGKGSTPVPKKAYDVLDYVDSHNGATPEGYRGNTTFANDGRSGSQRLPSDTTYREYDVNPYVKGQSRGAERLVVGANKSAYYTDDHYATLRRMR